MLLLHGLRRGLDGARRFLDRIWRLFVNEDGTLSNKIQESDDKTVGKSLPSNGKESD